MTFFWAILSNPRFLRVCKECNDSQGAALGYHCIAVDYQLQGSGVTKEAEDKQKSGATEILGSPSEKTIKPDCSERQSTTTTGTVRMLTASESSWHTSIWGWPMHSWGNVKLPQ